MRILFGLMAPVLVLAACSDDAVLSPEENARLASTCSTGPAQYGAMRSPPSGADFSKDLPRCAPRCGSKSISSSTFGETWAYESLPSGACTTGTNCQMPVSVTQTCGETVQACNLTGAECRCEGGQWRCYLGAIGGGACLPCDATGPGGPLDAGAR